MPNECYNYIIISCPNKDELHDLYTNELVKTEEDKQNDNLYYYRNIKFLKQTDNIIKFRQITKWNPDYSWLEGLIVKYPNCWIKNDWYDEDRMEGIWIGNTGDEDNIFISHWEVPIEVYKDRYY